MAMATQADGPKKLHGRAFYESIGSPKFIVAPMVDQSEFAWRKLARSLMPASQQLLAYSPMFHARLFAHDDKYRRSHFQAVRPGTHEPWLDGNPALDRPLIVQFCANDADILLAAAQKAAPYCDAVDLNLGCPQGIARKGHYGAFLQEDQELVFKLINTLHRHLSVPVTAKIRILDTKEATLAYARNVLDAGASILTVHGRRRDQKSHLTGLADWKMLRFLRDNLPPETVLFANGNILQHGDVQRCLDATGADAVMSAEGHLSDPTIFAEPPRAGEQDRHYWRGKDSLGGWRVDAVVRRYLDIIHRYALGQEPPQRSPLFVPGDDTPWLHDDANTEPPAKRRKTDNGEPADDASKPTSGAAVSKPTPDSANPNLSALQPHFFHLLRHLVTRHTDVRDQLARTRRGGIDAYEAVLAAVERKVAAGLLEYESSKGRSFDDELAAIPDAPDEPDDQSSLATVRRCKRPWWVAQPIIRPLPREALAKGAISLSKKKKKQEAKAQDAKQVEAQGQSAGVEQAVAQGIKDQPESTDNLVAG
ncbi:hypothetical protein CDD82_3842 [Ophiocordyceps australis]|uniref:tRNA-dihydrouridine(16/17) synthase [NAD(P)(+)] n=1 Tax=Ophiocordyceps australis TaxID=1399860 RepID=A0A2C5ZT84_9HYPO|nr:hypothetical protein CDD82_3842 [Ophiocordyceps australis]